MSPLTNEQRAAVDALVGDHFKRTLARWQTESAAFAADTAAQDGMRIAEALAQLAQHPHRLDRPAARAHLVKLLGIEQPEIEQRATDGSVARANHGLR